jgi:hypothetical protein
MRIHALRRTEPPDRQSPASCRPGFRHRREPPRRPDRVLSTSINSCTSCFSERSRCTRDDHRNPVARWITIAHGLRTAHVEGLPLPKMEPPTIASNAMRRARVPSPPSVKAPRSPHESSHDLYPHSHAVAGSEGEQVPQILQIFRRNDPSPVPQDEIHRGPSSPGRSGAAARRRLPESEAEERKRRSTRQEANGIMAVGQ